MTFDGKAFGKDVVETTKAYIDKTMAPLLAQIEVLKAEIGTLKQQPAPQIPDMPDMPAMIAATVEACMPHMKSMVDEAVASMPPAKDGAQGMKGDPGDSGPAGKDGIGHAGAMINRAGNLVVTLSDGTACDVGHVVGNDADMTVVKGMIDEATKNAVAAALAVQPKPQDGKSVTVEDVRPIVEESIARSIASLPVAKDAVGLAGAMIDRNGMLILTLSDGTTRDLGHVVGKDVDMAVVEGMIDKVTHKALAEAWAAIPEPKDGERGPQGEPGKSITVEDVAPLIKAAVQEATLAIPDVIKYAVEDQVAKLPTPTNGKDADPQLIIHMVTEAVMALPQPQNGKDADPALVQSLVKETVERAVAALPVAKDGTSVTIDDVLPLIEETVTKAVTLIPVPKDGASVTVADVAPMILAEVEKAIAVIPSAIAQTVEDEVAKLPPAPAGKDADPAIIKQMVTEAVATIPPAKNGKDGATIEELRPVIDETVAKAVSAIPIPKDGKNGLDAVKFLRGDKGNLIVTMSNGTVEDLGAIDGKAADMEAVERSIAEKVAAIPIPKDGVDGVGFDDLNDIEEDDGRFIVRQVFHAGKMVKETRIQTKVALYRGIHDQARTYLPGDQVSRGGSQWHCHTECKGAFNGDNWVLAVKKGRDGKPD